MLLDWESSPSVHAMSTRVSLRQSLRPLLLCGLVLVSASTHASEAQWIRISSDHFSVLTDAGEKKGRAVIVRFEQMRAVFAQLLMKTRLHMPEPLEIIALKTDKEFAQMAPLRQEQAITEAGFFIPGKDRNYIVLNLFEEESWQAVRHEFAHLLLNYNYPSTPGWFDEGFAEYFSSLRLDNKQVQIGSDPELTLAGKQDVLGNQSEVSNPPKSFTDLLSAPVWLALPDLFTVKHDTSSYQEGPHQTLFYAQSWIVMHYLLNKSKLPETGTYFDLVQNQKLPAEQAIQQAYGMTTAQLEQAVKEYFHSLAPLFLAQDAAKRPGTTNLGGQMYQFPSPVVADDVGSSVRQVPEAEAQAALAEMSLRLPVHREQALKELGVIVSQPKTDNAIAHRALAWAHLERKELGPATAELEKATELDAHDPWVRYYSALVKYQAAQLSGQAFQGLGNMMQDLRAVLDWDPEFAEAYSMLAMARVEGGGINSAMESIREAIQLSPRNENYLLNMALIYVAGRQWDAATALLGRLKSSPNPQIARAARKNLEDLPTWKKYGLLPRQPAAAPQTTGTTSAASPAAQSPPASAQKQTPQDREEALADHSRQSAGEPAPDKRPVQFLKGKLVTVDCLPAPAAVVTVTSGTKTMKLRTENYKALLLIGADEFSCGWRNRPVAVNYKAGGKADGDLVSLEVQ
jgi:Flp pilus assembly protein TadD